MLISFWQVLHLSESEELVMQAGEKFLKVIELNKKHRLAYKMLSDCLYELIHGVFKVSISC